MRRLSRKQKVKISIIAIVLLVAVGLFFWFNPTNTGSVSKENSLENPTQITGYKDLNGTIISFSYPAQYLQRTLEAKDNDFELYQLSAGTTYVKQVSVVVSSLPDGTLNSNSAYLMRKNLPNLYSRRPFNVQGLDVEIWKAIDGKEQTVFIEKGGVVTVLAFVQQGGDTDALTTEVDNLLATFRWKQ